MLSDWVFSFQPCKQKKNHKTKRCVRDNWKQEGNRHLPQEPIAFLLEEYIEGDKDHEDNGQVAQDRDQDADSWVSCQSHASTSISCSQRRWSWFSVGILLFLGFWSSHDPFVHPHVDQDHEEKGDSEGIDRSVQDHDGWRLAGMLFPRVPWMVRIDSRERWAVEEEIGDVDSKVGKDMEIACPCKDADAAHQEDSIWERHRSWKVPFLEDIADIHCLSVWSNWWTTRGYICNPVPAE